MKQLVLCVFVMSQISAMAQSRPSKMDIVKHYGFKQHEIMVEDEKIIYYTYQKGNTPKTRVVMFLQGSDPSPQFGYSFKDDTIRNHFWHWGEYKQLSEEYVYVIVEKLGFEGLIHADSIPEPPIYFMKNSLAHRVFRADAVLDYLVGKREYERVIVYGHSEGAPVAAKLATVNEHITHLGFWCGNALPDFYDFILENRIMYHRGELTAEESQQNIDATIEMFVNDIAVDTSDIDGGGYTNLRWWSYAEPPINHLLQVEIPVFVQVATEDRSAPIESTYLIPLEFARMQKTNLTYKVCIGCDHGFFVIDQNGKRNQKWHEIFRDFIVWTE